MRFRLPVLVVLAIALLSVGLFAQQIRGDYIETRSADVYTGQCFANGEVNLVGKEAIVAWHVQSGSWDGVSLDGLTIAAAVRAKATLGDPYANPYPAQSVLLVDDQASPQQSAALVSFAKHMGGELLSNVDQTVSAPMEMVVNHERHGVALLRAGQFATVQTRSLGDKDHVCGNESTFSPLRRQHPLPTILSPTYRGPASASPGTTASRRGAWERSCAGISV
jgi:hypothetical protein